MFKNLKKNNKGFTLVELIIVIAIIAILAAVLAPQFIQYVERSRESNDMQLGASVLKAASIAAGDPDVSLSGGHSVTWDVDTGTVTPSGAAGDAFYDAVIDITGADIGEATSAVATDDLVVNIAATGEITVTGTVWEDGGELELTIA